MTEFPRPTSIRTQFESDLYDLVHRYLVDGLENRDRMIDVLSKARRVVFELDAYIAAGEAPDPRVYMKRPLP